ncbi:hypothetical protein [Haloarchaeobius sp. DT45]|uniref:hypothetical protein n=1 Tax=Haloarchaeobius sp. DT45 TaxID=3446116 RepID=UPI003F6BD3BF
MTKMVKGEWRVLGFRADEERVLLHPLFEVDLPTAGRIGAAIPVGTANYGGKLQELVDALEPGNRVFAGVYPGKKGTSESPGQSSTPGRFAELELLDDQRLLLGFESDTTPRFVHEVWLEAVAGADGSELIAATRTLDVPGTVAEVYVASATRDTPNDLWWTFVGGGGDDAFFDSFEGFDGTPAEFVGANPESTPYFWVVKFGERDTDVAKDLASQTGIAPVEGVDVTGFLAENGLSGTARSK